MNKLPFIFIGLIVVVVVLLSSVFIVDERQKSLVIQFGKIKAFKEEPGLAFKIPVIQNFEYYD
ncbi:MAG: protease modulator HflC, partial [Pacificibacter sp.]